MHTCTRLDMSRSSKQIEILMVQQFSDFALAKCLKSQHSVYCMNGILANKGAFMAHNISVEC